MKLRFASWLLISLVLVLLCAWYGQITTSFNAAGTERTLVSFGIACNGFIAVFLFPDTSRKNSIFLILGLSILCRIALLPSSPSDDINRYLWEGKLTALGVSPYQAVATDAQYIPYRDYYWEKMNHRDKPTAYPPLAAHCFKWINHFGYHPMSYKVTFALLDLFLIATLLTLLGQLTRPLHWALFYALSPIALLSFAAEGHFDILMVLCIVLSLLFLSKKHMIAAGIAMGIAISTKIIAIVIAPLILWRTGWKGMLTACITIAAPTLIYFDDTLSMLNGLTEFGTNGRFNGPIYQLVSSLTNQYYALASQLTSLLFIVLWAIGFWLMLKRQLWAGLLVSFGSLILCSPIVHFWYLAWILPLVALRPKFAWLSLSFTMPLYFLVWDVKQHTGVWDLPLWAKWLFWLPFFLILLSEQKQFFSRIKQLLQSRLSACPPLSFSVIIPTLNPGEKLQQTLASIDVQTTPANEIILVDASSTDGSINEAQASYPKLKILHSELGRGAQIKAGCEAAHSSWCIVLHADKQLKPHALKLLKQAIQNNPEIIGGSFGQRFDRSSPGLLLIEVMNEFRATLLHNTFGDQTQFFHREIAIQQGVLTNQPLMEDVEMSNRLQAACECLHLAYEGSVSAQKWKKENFWKRFFVIVEFYAKYQLLSFSKKQRQQLSVDFYQRYYKK